MSRDVRLAVDVDVFIYNESGGEPVFQCADDVVLKIAVNLGDDGMKIGDENINMIVC